MTRTAGEVNGTKLHWLPIPIRSDMKPFGADSRTSDNASIPTACPNRTHNCGPGHPTNAPDRHFWLRPVLAEPR
jgi:hypothetical protein